MGNPDESFWSLHDPRSMTEGDWRNSHSVPPEWNAAERFVKGWVSEGNIVAIQPALPVEFNGIYYGGGAMEVILIDPNVTVHVLDEGRLRFKQ